MSDDEIRQFTEADVFDAFELPEWQRDIARHRALTLAEGAVVMTRAMKDFENAQRDLGRILAATGHAFGLLMERRRARPWKANKHRFVR